VGRPIKCPFLPPWAVATLSLSLSSIVDLE
jgi:hypothetical protein